MDRWIRRGALLATLTLSSGPAYAADLLVFAAASLKTALDEVVQLYEAGHDVDVTVSYGGTSTLARQIIMGAPADIFIAANVDWMDAVEAEDMLAKGTRRDLFGGSLVLISAAAGPALELSDLPEALGKGRLAMGLYDGVPAGIYGKAALSSLGLWDALAPQVVQTDNVRATLALVETGAAPFGIVYASDARASQAVHLRATFPAKSHPPIIYPAAIIDGHQQDVPADFFPFLASSVALDVFIANGFHELEERP